MSFSGPSGPRDNVRKLSFLGFNAKKSTGNEDPNEVYLDSEMEKVFAGPSAHKEKFDVTTFQDANQPIGSYKQSNVHRKSELNIEEDSEYESTTDPVNPQNYDDIPEDYPLVSERAGHGDHSVSAQNFSNRLLGGYSRK
ncbi:uncharacterized protein LOC118746557 [Rhagoletis pomonella]|uniref:uncharacterized protein LOC118746557 n=1 Tax=Rhagoletis pomonella TaxID=28610 RepID=UPI00177C619C|nr:uncharacterized protein LOC118746557 [Rhagoletis pomonella]